MKYRDVSVVAAAVLVGVMLSAISILSGPLQSAQTFSSMEEFQNGQRAASLRSAAPVQLSLSWECVLILSVVNDIHNEVMQVLPPSSPLLVYRNVNRIFEDAMRDCISDKVDEESLEAEMIEKELRQAAPVLRECLTPSFCNQFTRKRYMQCISAQRDGLCYRGGQMQRGG